MSALDPQIDDLYRRPPEEFTQARAELAKGLKGEEARRIKQLKKPTAAPWAVNQVYWLARAEFDRVLKTGEALRKAQLAALRGRSADLKAAAAAHRDAVAAAVAKAASLAAAASLNPSRDVLARTFEALSLASKPREDLGRLTEPLQPGGFEMLTGVEPSAGLKLVRLKPDATTEGKVRLKPGTTTGNDDRESSRGVRLQADHVERKRIEREKREAERAARARERELAAAARQREAAIKKAEAALARAKEQEAQSERAWRAAQEEVGRATVALRRIRSAG